MTMNDINRIYTEKVTDLLARGYQINPGTMSGSEGEYAKIDLRKGSEILRVTIENGRDHDFLCGDYIRIRVGRNTDRVSDRLGDSHIWTSHLQTLSEIKLAKVTDTFFTDMDEGKRIQQKRLDRWDARETHPKQRDLGEAFKSIALNWVRKQPRMKGCKPEEIESVTRVNRSYFAATLPDLECYEIKARGKTFRLTPPRKA